VVERHCVGFLSFCDRLRNLLSCLKFYLQRDSYSHVGNIYHLTYWYCKRGLRRRIAFAQCRFPAAGYKPAVSIGETYER
jgi:hypothetical protein